MITRPATDLTGRVFSRLTVLHREGSDRGRKPLWRCRCVCGDTSRVRVTDLLQGKTRSCGCLRAEASRRNAAALAERRRRTA
jgi:hypothetical protein